MDRTMGRRQGEDVERRLARSGVILAGRGMVPTPILTLSADYHDEPEPEDSDRAPEPEPRGRIGRLLARLRRRPAHTG